MRILALALMVLLGSAAQLLAQAETTVETPHAKSKNAMRQIEVEAVLIDAAEPDGLQALDRNALVERLTAMQEQGGVGVTRLTLKSLDARKARLQLGSHAPVESSRSVNRNGQTSRSYNYQQTGTILTTTSTLQDDESIVMELRLERTRLVNSPVVEEEGDSAPPETQTNQWESIVRVKSGETIVVSGQQSRTEGKSSQTWLLLKATASAPEAGGAK